MTLLNYIMTAMVSCSGILSVIICCGLSGRGFKIHFSVCNDQQKCWTMIFNYEIDFKTGLRKIFKWSKNKFTFQTGFAIGDIPLTHLYNTSQITLQRNHYSKNHLCRKNSFETMYFNRFSRAEFVYFQFKHGFNRSTILKKIKGLPWY
jgi:hypothetical protein